MDIPILYFGTRSRLHPIDLQVYVNRKTDHDRRSIYKKSEKKVNTKKTTFTFPNNDFSDSYFWFIASLSSCGSKVANIHDCLILRRMTNSRNNGQSDSGMRRVQEGLLPTYALTLLPGREAECARLRLRLNAIPRDDQFQKQSTRCQLLSFFFLKDSLTRSRGCYSFHGKQSLLFDGSRG
jgi:hypothetical protein